MTKHRCGIMVRVKRFPSFEPLVPHTADALSTELSAAKEDRGRALALGADEYLMKPIQANRVLAVAKSLLKLT